MKDCELNDVLDIVTARVEMCTHNANESIPPEKVWLERAIEAQLILELLDRHFNRSG